MDWLGVDFTSTRNQNQANKKEDVVNQKGTVQKSVVSARSISEM